MLYLRLNKYQYIKLEKARDLSKLVKKVIIDKNGNRKTVYVRIEFTEKRQKQINKIIKFLSNEKIEHGICFNDKGKVINYKIGNEKYINYPQVDLYKMNNAKLYIHNHPKGNSLSVHDLKFLMVNNINKIIAFGTLDNNIYSYELQLKKQIELDKIDYYKDEYTRIAIETYDILQERIDKKIITKEKASNNFYHIAMESFTNNYKDIFHYEKKQRT